MRGAGAVDRYISASYDDGIAFQPAAAVAERLAEKAYGNFRSFRCFVRNAGQFSALAADSDIECLVTLLFQIIDGKILSDLDSAANTALPLEKSTILSWKTWTARHVG